MAILYADNPVEGSAVGRRQVQVAGVACPLWALTFLVLTHLPLMAHDTADIYSIGPAPEWVIQHTTPKPKDADATNSSSGIQYLLVDRQYKEYRDPAYFFRYVYRVENVEGRSDSSDLSVHFDPSFEHVTLHDVTIFRDGKPLDRLTGADVAVLRQENELEKQVYDGGRTLHILLNDVRVGDIIDYSFTTHGKNPVFADSVNINTTVQWSTPAALRRLRLLVPPDRALFSKAIGIDEQPRVTHHSDFKEYVWEASNLAGIKDEDDVPSWFSVYPSIQITSFPSWASVVDEELKIYTSDRPLPEDLKSVIAEIQSAHPEKPDQLVAALRFVQNEIRYVAITMGTGGYIPNPPEKTLRRRYGDCKDKTFLLLAMLDALDIQGHPVLVHTGEGKVLDQYLPSRRLFDHMIAQATIEDEIYWLDGTLTHQAGNADHMYQPDYGKALVVRPGATGLVEMSSRAAQKPLAELRTEIDASGGPSSDIFLTVQTTMRGPKASYARSWLDRDMAAGIQETYLNFYRGYFDTIEIREPIDVRFNDALDEVTITETYAIKDGWIKEDDEWSFAVVNEEFYDVLDIPDTDSRLYPFDLYFPNWEVHTSTIKLPGKAWAEAYETQNHSLNTEHYTFDWLQEVSGNDIVVRREYKALKDHVAPSELEAYKRTIESAEEYADSRYLYFPAHLTDKTNTGPAIAFLARIADDLAVPGFLLGAWFALLAVNRIRLRRALREEGARLMSFQLAPVTERLTFKGDIAQVWRLLPSLSFLEGMVAVQSTDQRSDWDPSLASQGASMDLTYMRKRNQPLSTVGTISEFVPEEKLTIRFEPHALYHDPAFKNYLTSSELTIELQQVEKSVHLRLTDARDYQLTEKLYFSAAKETKYLRKYLRRSAKNIRKISRRTVRS